METLLLISLFILGAIVGSFLNVVILRYRTSIGMGGRSFCTSCSATLRWYELIPILSYIIQGGKCRVCHSRISPQYPLVEFTTGAVFVLVFLHSFNYLIPGIEMISSRILDIVLNLIIFSSLIVVAAYDIRHKIIPDTPVYIFIGLSFIALFVSGANFVVPTLLELLAGPILTLPFVLLWAFSRGRLIGFGDAKIALGIGFLLGVSGGFMSLILSFWIGALVSIFLIIVSRVYKRWFKGAVFTLKSQLPFAPFLVLSTIIAFLLNLDLLSFFLF